MHGLITRETNLHIPESYLPTLFIYLLFIPIYKLINLYL